MLAKPFDPPFFVFGALRSGTTLFRLMLNGHGDISNPGEVDFLFDFVQSDPGDPSGWHYDRDAMQKHRIFRARDLYLPSRCDGIDLLHSMIDQLRARATGTMTLTVHRHCDRIVMLLPKARFIHLVRDPRDVSRSSIAMGWAGNSYYGVDHWMATEHSWDAAAKHIAPEQVLTVKFEALMAEPETELRRVCAFLGVPYSPTMLEYPKYTNYGRPDPGIAEKWRRTASTREVALLEGKCADLLVARGYVLDGDPVFPGVIEQLMLAANNLVGRWHHGIRRFGWPLFISAHLTRYFGPKVWKERLRQRMDEKIIKGLK